MTSPSAEEKRMSTISTNSAAIANHDLFSNPQFLTIEETSYSQPIRNHDDLDYEDEDEDEDTAEPIFYVRDKEARQKRKRDRQHKSAKRNRKRDDSGQSESSPVDPVGSNQYRNSMISNASSISKLRRIFRSSNNNSDVSIDRRDFPLNTFTSNAEVYSEMDLAGRNNLFSSNFDTDDEDDAEEATRNSIHSSIINKMANVFNDNGNVILNKADGTGIDLGEGDDDDRFKFLRTYEKLHKAQQKDNHIKEVISSMKNQQDIPLQTIKTSASDASSVFGLSRLDDFNKYIKQTELNDMIHEKILAQYPENDNVLGVMATNDLAKNFYADENNFNSENVSKKSKAMKTKPSWYTKDWKIFNNSSKVTGTMAGDGNESLSTKNTKKSGGGMFKSPMFQRDSKKNISPTLVDSSELYSNTSASSMEKSKKFLQRKLKVRHLQMISFGGTLGVGLFLNTGKALTISGGFGTILAFIICGIVVLATIVSFCEMVTFISVVDGVSGLSSRFVDDSFGFAVGWLYWASFAFGLAGEVVASVIMLAYYPQLKIPQNKGASVGFVTLFLLSILLVNLIDVRIFGEIEYISSLIKLVAALVMIVLMIVMNTGGLRKSDPYVGFKYWDHSKSNFEHNIIFGLFRPTFNLHDTGSNPPTEGQGGNEGRFLSLLTAIVVVAYAYSGTEIVCIAACEAKNPRKALPSATKRVFWRIIIFYCLSAFLVSLNIYAGDPRLLRYLSGSTGVDQSQFYTDYAIKYVGGVNCVADSKVFAGFGNGAQSPWIVALQSSKMCTLSSLVNGFFVFFAVSCGNAQLYVSSRTLYSLALQKKAPKFLTYCSSSGIPYNSVLFSAAFGLLSYLCVSEEATVVFQNLTSLIASSGVLVWFAMCLSYIRFYYGLKRRPDIINRDDRSYPYKSPFQPYSAFVGLIGSTVIILAMGFTVFLKGEWDVMFFFSSYGTLLVFAVLYFGYKLVKGARIPSLDTLDFDSGRTELDRYIWDGGRDYNIKNFKDVMHKWISFLA